MGWCVLAHVLRGCVSAAYPPLTQPEAAEALTALGVGGPILPLDVCAFVSSKNEVKQGLPVSLRVLPGPVC